MHFSVLSRALQFDVHHVVSLLLLFVLEEEQFICSKRRSFWCTVILITCPSAPLLVVTFVDSVHLYCYCRYCWIFCLSFCWLTNFPRQVGVPCSFYFILHTVNTGGFFKPRSTAKYHKQNTISPPRVGKIILHNYVHRHFCPPNRKMSSPAIPLPLQGEPTSEVLK